MRRLTHEEFMEKFKKQNKHAKNIEILGTYINNETKIGCKCKVCEHEWKSTPKNLLRGAGCPKCGKKRMGQKKTKTHEQFIQELEQINPNIELLETYINAHTKIKCKCKIDGYEWTPTPNNLLIGAGCPKCATNNNKKTHEQFLQELYKINENIEVLGTYVTDKTKIKVRCKLDGYKWTTRPHDLLKGHGCPKCKISKGEKRIAQYLDNLGINYIYDKPYFNDLVGTGGILLRPDFIIPSLKIWIEYDGIQHYEPTDFTGKMSEQQIQERFETGQQNDNIKDQYAKDHNWTLIRIPFTDYYNIEQILANYLEEKNIKVG